MRTGVKGASAIDLARRIIDKFGTFRNMNHTDMREWKEFKGLGPAKIAQIQAALEIGRRFREVEILESKPKIIFFPGYRQYHHAANVRSQDGSF